MGATIRTRRMKVFRFDAALTELPDIAAVPIPVP